MLQPTMKLRWLREKYGDDPEGHRSARESRGGMMREIPARKEVDKPSIKKAIGGGKDVPGARIVEKDRLEIKA